MHRAVKMVQFAVFEKFKSALLLQIARENLPVITRK